MVARCYWGMCDCRWWWVADGGGVLLGNAIAGFHGGAVLLVVKCIVMVASRWWWVADGGFHGGAVFLGNGIAGGLLGNVIAGDQTHCNGGFQVVVGCRWWWCVIRECRCRFPWWRGDTSVRYLTIVATDAQDLHWRWMCDVTKHCVT